MPPKVNWRRMEKSRVSMRSRHSPIRQVHALMPFAHIVLVGRRMRVGALGRIMRMRFIGFMPMRFIVYIVSGPEIPDVGMSRFHVGTMVIRIGVGMQKQEGREGG